MDYEENYLLCMGQDDLNPIEKDNLYMKMLKINKDGH